MLNRVVTSLALIACLLNVACSEQAFRAAIITQSQPAPGNFLVPPKIDILLAEDDTGSIIEAYPAIAAQLPIFLQALEEQNWDYRFATTPLTNQRSLDQIQGAKFDANWSLETPSLWSPSFPGQSPNMLTAIASSFFRKPDNYNHLITLNQVNNTLNGLEPGLETIVQALTTEAPQTNFLRPDAMTIVFALGNGEDTSGVTFCTRADGLVGPCEQVGFPAQGTMASSFNSYKNQLLSLVSSGATSDIRFVSAVAQTATGNCLGSTSRVGTRYMDMAQALGGISIDICSQPVPAILGAFQNFLEEIRIAYRTRFLIMDSEPNPETIQVLVYRNGVTEGLETIPNDPINGWTYLGGPNTVFTTETENEAGNTIFFNEATGYIIELHGDAIMRGNDTVDIRFQPVSAGNASG